MAKDNMIVKFVRDYEVKDEHEGTDRATRYEKDQRKSLPRASAQHFIDRNIAVPAGPAKRPAAGKED